jgi:hypothetical protein
MGQRRKCSYCDELAVAHRVVADGAKAPICTYHIPVNEDQLPESRDSGAAADDKNQADI